MAGERWIEWLEIYILKFEIIPLMDRLKMIENIWDDWDIWRLTYSLNGIEWENIGLKQQSSSDSCVKNTDFMGDQNL